MGLTILGSVLCLSANDGSAQCGGEVGRTLAFFHLFLWKITPVLKHKRPKEFSCLGVDAVTFF